MVPQTPISTLICIQVREALRQWTVVWSPLSINIPDIVYFDTTLSSPLFIPMKMKVNTNSLQLRKREVLIKAFSDILVWDHHFWRAWRQAFLGEAYLWQVFWKMQSDIKFWQTSTALQNTRAMGYRLLRVAFCHEDQLRTVLTRQFYFATWHLQSHFFYFDDRPTDHRIQSDVGLKASANKGRVGSNVFDY